MSLRDRGKVVIEIEGKPYTLVLTTNAMCEAEEMLSTPGQEVAFADILAKVMKNSVRHVRVLVWAALLEHHPQMKLADAGNLITAAGGLEAFAQHFNALTDATAPDPKDADTAGVKRSGGKSARPRKAQAPNVGTGGNSTSTAGASV